MASGAGQAREDRMLRRIRRHMRAAGQGKQHSREEDEN
jgi:hypothetical protein